MKLHAEGPDLGFSDVAGSFRDPLSRVRVQGQRVLRVFNDLGDRDRAHSWDFMTAQARAGRMIQSTLLELGEAPDGVVSMVEHPRLDLITYPFEWSFGMLKDAALLQLELVRDAAKAGVGVKDATPYNIQFVGSTPLFIDGGSFQKRVDTDPWFGYQQFCELFLYPLMLRSYAGVPFQPILRGSVNGIPVEDARGLLGPVRAKWQKGRLTHVLLHALAQRKMSDADAGVAEDVAESGMTTEVVLATVTKMMKLVAGLDIGIDESLWSDYTERGHYDDRGLSAKAEFVASSLASSGPLDHCWDVGCNDGMFSHIASKYANRVLAMDADELVVDRLYQQLKRDSSEAAARITPLVVDLSAAGGGIGWRGTERPGLFDRSSPDAVIYLAVIHHLALTFNIPIEHQIDLLADITENLVIEFPGENDPMVMKLLRNKRAGIHGNYNTENFEDALRSRFTIENQQLLEGGTRTIYFARRV